jgi:hypothetical protein
MTTPSVSAYPLPRAVPPQTSKLAEALAAFQAELPSVEKNRTAEVSGVSKAGKPYSYPYKYADLADVSSVVLKKLGEHGLSFMSRPTTVNGKFGLAYSLLHSSGEREDGFFELRDDPDIQKIGGRITYARRYCLCAVTGVAAEEDTDARGIGQASPPQQQRKPRGRPPVRPLADLPRNQDGSLSRSRITDEEFEAYGNMTAAQLKEHTELRDGAAKGAVPGTERLAEADPADPWANPPAGLRKPSPAQPRAAVIIQHFARMGITDREERLGFTAELIGRKVGSTNDLTAQEGIDVVHKLGKCKDQAALRALLDATGSPPEAP